MFSGRMPKVPQQGTWKFLKIRGALLRVSIISTIVDHGIWGSILGSAYLRKLPDHLHNLPNHCRGRRPVCKEALQVQALDLLVL